MNLLVVMTIEAVLVGMVVLLIVLWRVKPRIVRDLTDSTGAEQLEALDAAIDDLYAATSAARSAADRLTSVRRPKP